MSSEWAAIVDKLLDRFPVVQILLAIVFTAVTWFLLPVAGLRDAWSSLRAEYGVWVPPIVAFSVWLLVVMGASKVLRWMAAWLAARSHIQLAKERTHNLMWDEQALLRHFLASGLPVMDKHFVYEHWKRAAWRLSEDGVLRLRTLGVDYEIVPEVRAYLIQHPEVLNPAGPLAPQ